jgi:hypothetical protein
MVKYLTVVIALAASLAVADLAEARGRRGCASCNVGGGCPGGVCAVPAAPAKMAVTEAPPAAVVESSAPAPAAAVTGAPVSSPRYYSNTTARRGLFGWRR